MKRIIILCDGTGNSSSRDHNHVSTNVKRLSDAIAPKYNVIVCPDKTHEKGNSGVCLHEGCEHKGERGEEHDQIVYYQSGVGTAQYGSLYKAYAGGTGTGINDNILDAYHFLASNHQNGDEIFIFGFSRGAYTARVVANLVQQLGIFHKSRSWMMRKAWIQYKKDDNGKSFEHFCKSMWKVDAGYTKPAVVKVLGVWDTVGCVGMPDYVPGALNSEKYYQTHILEGGVEFVFHALAVDEYRRTFGPTMFFLPKTGEKRTYEKTRGGKSHGVFPVLTAKKTVLKQCWFPGVHSNVGGSYQSEHLADIAIAWMIDQCIINGHLLTFDRFALFRLVDRHLHPEKNLDSFHNGVVRKYPGWGAGTVYDSYKGSMWYMTWQYRAPGNYILDGEHLGRGNTGHPGQYGMWSFPSWSDMTSWVSSKPTASDYCTDPGCCHPAKKGKYDLDPVTGFPILDKLAPGATCETMHGSIYARYVASVEAEKKEKEYREHESKQQESVTVANPSKGEDKALPTSLVGWNPEALAPFRTGEPHDPEKLNRYMRKPMWPGGPIVWTGRCLKTGKLFEMLEEPDRLMLPEEDAEEEKAKLQRLGEEAVAKRAVELERNKAYNRAAVGNMVRRMNLDAGPPSALASDNPYERHGETDEQKEAHLRAEKEREEQLQALLATETSEQREKRLQKEAKDEKDKKYTAWLEKKKQWMDHIYLQEDFELEDMEKLLILREKKFLAENPDPSKPVEETGQEASGWRDSIRSFFGV